jgi:hypothetical protein
MTKVETLEREVQALSSQDLAKVRLWFADFDADLWDRQLEGGARSGKLDSLAARALAAHHQGKSREL